MIICFNIILLVNTNSCTGDGAKELTNFIVYHLETGRIVSVDQLQNIIWKKICQRQDFLATNYKIK